MGTEDGPKTQVSEERAGKEGLGGAWSLESSLTLGLGVGDVFAKKR